MTGKKLEGVNLRDSVRNELESLKYDISSGRRTQVFEVAALLDMEDVVNERSSGREDHIAAAEKWGEDFLVPKERNWVWAEVNKTRYGWDFFVDRAIKRIGKDAVLNILLELEET